MVVVVGGGQEGVSGQGGSGLQRSWAGGGQVCGDLSRLLRIDLIVSLCVTEIRTQIQLIVSFFPP